MEPLSLKKGDVVYLEVAGNPSALNYKFTVKEDAKLWKGDDVYVRVLAEETVEGVKVVAACRGVLNLPVDTYKSTARYYKQVFLLLFPLK